MALSKDAQIKLLDAMQKGSLAITAVSLGLFSSVLLSRTSVQKEAEPELKRLVEIRDRIGKKNASEVIEEALKGALERMGYEPGARILKAKVTTIGSTGTFSCDVSLLAPTECTWPANPSLAGKRFSEIQTLEEMRPVWNEIAAKRMFWRTTPETKIRDAFLLLGSEQDFTYRSVEWLDSDDAAPRILNFVAAPEPFKGGAEGDAIRNEYDFLPAVNSSFDLNQLMQFFQVKEENRDRLKNIHLIVEVSAKGYDFYPALALDPVLGKMANFAQAFPNLEKLTAHYQSENFRSLGTLLEEAVSQQPKGELEVLGIKVPSDLIALLGLPVLFILLFQFSAVGFYVASTVEQIGEEEAAAWSFLLPRWPFLFMSVGTIFVLPAAASIFTFFFLFGEDRWTNPTRSVLPIIVLICSAVAVRAILRLRSRVRDAKGPIKASHQDQDVDHLSD